MAVKVSVGPGIKAILIAMITLAMVLVAVRWNRVIAPQRATAPVGALGAGAFPAATGDAAVVPAAVPAAGADLRRPLKVAINTWGGYAGGILANRGQLAPSAQSAFRAQFGIDVELVLIDDFAASRAAFRTGGDSGGVDVMWATVDSFALEYPSLERDYHPVAFMQFDFSRGGDAIAATREIRNAADLRGKRVAYTPATPSHYFLLYVLAQAGLTPDQIVKVETASAPEAASAFRAGTVDAAVSWAPDVFNAAAARSGGHILSSTREANRLIADVFYTRRDFLAAHPGTFQRFVAGWMHGQQEAAAHPAAAAAAMARAFTGVSLEDAAAMLENAELTGYHANRAFFEMDGDLPVGYEDIFRSASGLWRRVGQLNAVGTASYSRDVSILTALAPTQGPAPAAAPVGGTFAAPAPAAAPATITRRVQIFFAPGSSELDPNATLTLEQLAELAATFGGAQIRVAGNTDSTGPLAVNVELSRRRAQSVVDSLVAQFHFERNKFTVTGNGPNVPVCSEATDECRRRNRRTDIEILEGATPPAPTPRPAAAVADAGAAHPST